MKVEYRIANIEGACFPHVRFRRLFWWSSWKSIRYCLGSCYLEPTSDLTDPLSEQECRRIIERFDATESLKNKKATYIKVA